MRDPVPSRQVPPLDAPKRIVGGIFLALYTLFLFTHLGHYALWDDEANTALFGQSVWHTGDTDARIGENIVAFRNGFELEGTANRRIAPLQYYVAAPWVALVGGTWGARLPFAICGLLFAVFVQLWLWRSGAPTSRWILVNLGLLGNVSLILYARQARYYALAVLLATVIAFLHARFDGSRGMRIGLAAASVALLATHYLAWVSVAAAFAVDFFLFGWRRTALRARDVAFVAAAHATAGGAIVARWNPLGKPLSDYVPESWWADKATLWWWNLRDLNGCEFVSLAFVVLAPLLWAAGKKDEWLLRIPLGIVAGAAAVALFSPMPVGRSDDADVRYMIVAIPAGIFLTVRILEAIPVRSHAVRYAVAMLVFGTNVVHLAATPLLGTKDPEVLRSTLLAYLGELHDPPPSPYREAADWLRRHATPGDTVLVAPDFAAYPLMVQLPELIYVWQLPAGARSKFPTLAPHHFRGEGRPTWLVSFGESVRAMRSTIIVLRLRGSRYRHAHTITHVRGQDETRPELTLRTFQARAVNDRKTQGIYLHRRIDP